MNLTKKGTLTRSLPIRYQSAPFLSWAGPFFDSDKRLQEASSLLQLADAGLNILVRAWRGPLYDARAPLTQTLAYFNPYSVAG